MIGPSKRSNINWRSIEDAGAVKGRSREETRTVADKRKRTREMHERKLKEAKIEGDVRMVKYHERKLARL